MIFLPTCAAILSLLGGSILHLNNPVDAVVQSISYSEEALQYENRWDITLTEEEIDTLAKIVYLEAGNQNDVGQQLVVVVIFNRMKDGRFGDGLTGVLSAKGQFSTWKNRNSAKPTEKEYENILAVLHSETEDWVGNTQYLYFNSLGNGTKIGGHYFH